MQDNEFLVKDESITFSVAIYSVTSVLALGILIFRRLSTSCGKAELGGPPKARFISAGLLILLWAIYILLSALKSYDHL